MAPVSQHRRLHCFAHDTPLPSPLLFGRAVIGTAPTSAPGKILKVLVAEKLFMRSANSSTVGKLIGHENELLWSVGPKKGKGNKAAGITTSITRDHSKNISKSVLILDSSGEEYIAVVTRYPSFKRQWYSVHGFHPMVPHQPSQPYKVDGVDQGKSLFNWAKVEKNDSGRIVADLYNKGGEMVIGDQLPMGLLGDNIRLLMKDGRAAAVLRKGQFPTDNGAPQGPVWDCTVAPGIDPLLIICMMAINDDAP